MDVFAQAAQSIIKEQQGIIGPLALEQAKKVTGLKVSGDKVSVEGNKKDVLSQLVSQYQRLFGQTSVEVCKEAIRNIQLPASETPDLLR